MGARSCVMFSGGMDSLITALSLPEVENLVFVRLQHRYQVREEYAANQLARTIGRNLKVLSGPDLSRFERADAYIPGRNLVLAYMGALEHDGIWFCFQKGELAVSDRTSRFCQLASEALSQAMNREVVVDGAFANMYKDQMVEWFIAQGYPLEWLKIAWSCYFPSQYQRECGACKACLRKYMAIKANGKDCEDWFEIDPRMSEVAGQYVADMLEYDEHRQALIREVLEGKCERYEPPEEVW